MSQLPKGGRVLDLGCGPGRSAAAMRDAGFSVDAWDASPQMATIGAEKFDLAIEIRDFDSLTAESEYDGIFANFSLLHAPKSDMPRHLHRIAKALKPGGLFHIGLKIGDGEARDKLGRFYAYYQDAELTALLEEAGLSVETRNFGADEGLDGTLAPWMILTARKI
jgi:trans-aconitate methyltransferase